jgi:Cu/Ag efflux pump CusA
VRSIIGWSQRSRLLVVGAAAVLLVLGFTQLRSMPADTLPEFTPPHIEIQTEALGLSANEVEQLITVPLEADLLNQVKGVSTIRSESVPGLSSIVLVFEPGTDILTARQYTQEKLSEAIGALPNVSTAHQMIQPLSSQSRVLMIGLGSAELSPIQQGVLARWTIRPRLMGVPGVANVEIWGQRERQLQVLVDPKKLQKRNVSLLQVIKTAGNAQLVSPLSFLEGSTPGTGGFFDTPNQRLGVRHVFPIAKPDDLAKVKLEGGGDGLHLGDVSEVVEGNQPLIGDAVVNDGSGLMLVVEKLPGANTREVTEGVQEALDELQPGLAGLELDSTVFRPADFVDDAISHLTVALLLGLILAALAIALFLFEWRAALTALASIAVSLVAAALVLDLLGTTVNALVFAGLMLAVALVVHSAVLHTDTNVSRRPALYATLIVLLSIVPVVLLEGVAGELFRPLVLTYGLTTLTALLTAMTVTPALASLLPAGAREGRRESPALAWLRPRYERALSRAMAGPAVLLAAAVVAILGLAVLPALEQSSLPGLLPRFKERELLIHFDGKAGTSQPEMTRVAARATAEMRSLPGVRNVGAHIGRAVGGDVVGGVNRGEIWVSLGEDADYDETVGAIRRVAGGYPGLDDRLVTYSQERADAIGGTEDGADDDRNFKDDDVVKALDSDLAVRVYGQDLDVLRGLAGRVEGAVAGLRGVARTSVAPQVFEPNVVVEPDLAAAERVGIKPGEVRRSAATLLSGITVGSLFEEQKVFDVVVWGAPEIRRSVQDIRDLPIDLPGGGHVRLGDVAKVQVEPTPNDIRREAVARYVDVGVDVGDRDRDAVVDDIEQSLKGVDFPLEYHAEVVDESAERGTAFNRVLGFAIAAAVGIFLLLQAAFGSWRLASLVFLTLPAALAGGLIAIWIDGSVLSTGSAIGLLGALGLAALNGLVFVSRCQRLEHDEGESPGPAPAARGAIEGFPAIVAGGLATTMLFIPVLVAGATAGLEVVHPMAVAVVGGLLASTLITLFVMPALYLRFGRSPNA